MRPNLIRRDGTFWTSSYNPDKPMIGLFDQSQAFYFIELKRWLWVLWKPTGSVWVGGDMRVAGFQTIKEVKENARRQALSGSKE